MYIFLCSLTRQSTHSKYLLTLSYGLNKIMQSLRITLQFLLCQCSGVYKSKMLLGIVLVFNPALSNNIFSILTFILLRTCSVTFGYFSHSVIVPVYSFSPKTTYFPVILLRIFRLILVVTCLRIFLLFLSSLNDGIFRVRSYLIN